MGVGLVVGDGELITTGVAVGAGEGVVVSVMTGIVRLGVGCGMGRGSKNEVVIQIKMNRAEVTTRKMLSHFGKEDRCFIDILSLDPDINSIRPD